MLAQLCVILLVRQARVFGISATPIELSLSLCIIFYIDPHSDLLTTLTINYLPGKPVSCTSIPTPIVLANTSSQTTPRILSIEAKPAKSNVSETLACLISLHPRTQQSARGGRRTTLLGTPEHKVRIVKETGAGPECTIKTNSCISI